MKLFYEGGPLFMGILTLILLVNIVLAIYLALQILNDKQNENSKIANRLSLIKSVGLFAFVVGIFAQLIGLFEAFGAIQQMGDVSPSMLAGGFQVSLITNLYGIAIFLFSYLMWFGLVFLKGKDTSDKSAD